MALFSSPKILQNFLDSRHIESLDVCMEYLSTKASRQSTLGYTHGSSLSVDGAQTTNDGDARHGQAFYPGSAAELA